MKPLIMEHILDINPQLFTVIVGFDRKRRIRRPWVGEREGGGESE